MAQLFVRKAYKLYPAILFKSLNICQRSCSMASSDAALEKLKANPYYVKYSEKIAVLQQTSPEEFLAKFQESKNHSTNKAKSGDRNFSGVTNPKQHSESSKDYLLTKQKTLNDVMKLELIKDKTAEEIEEIWRKYYKDRDGIAAAIPAEVYDEQFKRCQTFPIFLFPLPRSQGYEFILCQFSGHEAHFTSLINYQAYKDNAPECLTIIHYPDIKEEKGIVLMRGEYDEDVLNIQEAQCLANQLQLYYRKPNQKREKLLERFTNIPSEFKYMDLVAELECLTL